MAGTLPRRGAGFKSRQWALPPAPGGSSISSAVLTEFVRELIGYGPGK
jgi:hypothetical protein